MLRQMDFSMSMQKNIARNISMVANEVKFLLFSSCLNKKKASSDVISWLEIAGGSRFTRE